MKKISIIKEAFLTVTMVTTVMLFASCDNNQQSEDTKEIAEERNDEKFDNKKQQKDAQFLVKASEMNLEEIQLGQLAQQRGRSSHIKELGKMMEDAHTKSQTELSALAKSKGITIPNSPTNDAKDAYKNLNDKSDDDFDQEYANLMVRKHKDAIDAFEKAAEDATDPEVRSWAKSSLPELRKHLDHAVKSQKQLDNMSLEKKK